MEGKISHTGLLARSPEGHAAHGMQIKGNEDVWVEIQANTFKNWVNEHLPTNLRVVDLSQDLCSGVTLCALVEALQGHPIKPAWNRRPANQHHYLENVTAALNAIEQDGVKLVNIGNVDIVNGNLKLILGLIWSLIVRYQIGRSKFPPRKLMLAWLQAVLPECKVNNFTTDWNSGILLSALIDYCRPGLFSHWRKLDKNNGIENCRRAMDIAQRDLGIPAVLEPEYLASPWLDELSGMTYLSYFMKPKSPGFHATLRWVNSRLERPLNNFTSDWNDGKAICEIIRSLGGSAPAPDKLRSDPSHWESNLYQALEAGKRLGVQPILSAKDMADTHVEHLGVMAYTAHYQWIPERPPLHDLINVRLDSTSGRVGEPTHFQITLLDSSLSYNHLSADVRAPDNRLYSVRHLKQGHGTFVPQKVGMHELIVLYDSQEVSAKHYFRVLPLLVEVAPPGMAPCALGSLVQVLVNATGAPRREDIRVIAYSPHGRPLNCPLKTVDGTNTATFKPDEPGEWRIEITYQGKQIQGGPFTCSVFDPNGVQVSGLEGALPLVPHIIDVDCGGVGVPGEVYADIVHDKRTVHCRMEKADGVGFMYRIHFTPKSAGKHRVYIYFNGYDVKGSPFMMRVGTQRRSKSSNSSPNATYRQSPTSSSRLNTPSPINHNTQLNSSYNSNKNSSYTKYRENASPNFGNSTHKYAQDYHRLTVSENRLLASSPTFDDRLRPNSPGPIPRISSPSLAPRAQSPSYNRPQSPDYISSKKLNERRYETASPNFVKNTEYDSSYINKKSALRASDSHNERRHETASPNFAKTTEYDSSYNNKKSGLRVSDSHNERRHETASPNFAKKTEYDSSYINKKSALRVSDSHNERRHETASPNFAKTTEYDSSYNNKKSGLRVSDSHNERRHETVSPNFAKTTEYDSSYNNKMSGLRVSDSHNERRHETASPNFAKKTEYDSSYINKKSALRVSDLHNERRHETASPNFAKRTEYDSTYNNKMSGLHVSDLHSERRHETPSPNFAKKTEYDSTYNNKMLGVSDSHSPNFIERSSPNLGYTSNSRYDKKVTESRTYNSSSYDHTDAGVDTTPIIKVSGVNDHSASRRDSWDAIAKTRNILSHRSLESVANLTNSQLDKELQQSKFEENERAKLQEQNYSSQVYSQNYSSNSQNYSVTDRAYNSLQRTGGKNGGATAIKVQPVPDGVLGQPVEFEIDGSGAGSGDLEILVEGGKVTSSVRSLGGQRFKAAFTPHQALSHRVDIRFNGETVPGKGAWEHQFFARNQAIYMCLSAILQFLGTLKVQLNFVNFIKPLYN